MASAVRSERPSFPHHTKFGRLDSGPVNGCSPHLTTKRDATRKFPALLLEKRSHCQGRKLLSPLYSREKLGKYSCAGCCDICMHGALQERGVGIGIRCTHTHIEYEMSGGGRIGPQTSLKHGTIPYPQKKTRYYEIPLHFPYKMYGRSNTHACCTRNRWYLHTRVHKHSPLPSLLHACFHL